MDFLLPKDTKRKTAAGPFLPPQEAGKGKAGPFLPPPVYDPDFGTQSALRQPFKPSLKLPRLSLMKGPHDSLVDPFVDDQVGDVFESVSDVMPETLTPETMTETSTDAESESFGEGSYMHGEPLFVIYEDEEDLSDPTSPSVRDSKVSDSYSFDMSYFYGSDAGSSTNTMTRNLMTPLQSQELNQSASTGEDHVSEFVAPYGPPPPILCPRPRRESDDSIDALSGHVPEKWSEEEANDSDHSYTNQDFPSPPSSRSGSTRSIVPEGYSDSSDSLTKQTASMGGSRTNMFSYTSGSPSPVAMRRPSRREEEDPNALCRHDLVFLLPGSLAMEVAKRALERKTTSSPSL